MPSLFDPFSLGNLTLRNRIVVSPMQQYSSAKDGMATDWHLVHLGSRAVGGAGLVISEALPISLTGRWTASALGIWSDAHTEGLSRITRFVKQQGAAMVAQLGHAAAKGSRNHPTEGFTYISEAEGGWEVIGPSAFNRKGLLTPTALTKKGIREVTQQFVAGAKRALAAGFDGVEIHAAHGYLLHEFYSILTNQRTDEYGGSFENRVRFLREVTQAVKAILPGGVPLLVRISAVDFGHELGSWQIEDSVALAKLLKEDGAELITASGGGIGTPDQHQVVPGYQVPYAEQIRKEAGIPTGAVGLITEARQAEEIITSGKADVVVIAREHLRDPYFALHAAQELGTVGPVPVQYLRAFK